MQLEFTDKFDVIYSENLSLKITQKYMGDNEMLPFYYYDIFNSENDCVGKISIRIGHNFHSYYNGNIGYEIFKEYRGHGLARIACQAVLQVAKFHGMESLAMKIISRLTKLLRNLMQSLWKYVMCRKNILLGVRIWKNREYINLIYKF